MARKKKVTAQDTKKTKKKPVKSTKQKIQAKKKQRREEKNLEHELDQTLVQTKEIEKPEDWYPYCRYDTESKSIVLDLEALFDRTDIDYANTFALTKRNYHSIADQIVDDYNLILNSEECEDFIYYLLEVKGHIVEIKEAYLQEGKGYVLKNKKMTDFEKKSRMVLDKEDKDFLVKKINKIVKLDYLFDFISNFVDDHYELNLNTRINVNEKNLEYAITDTINKTVLKTSIVARLVIPLVNEINMSETDLYKLLTRVMNKFDGDTVRTKDKLYKFIELRVNRTRYSDMQMWDFLSNRAIDSTLFISELNRKILNEIVAKLEYNKSIVSYFDVIIRFKIKFLFTYNYNVNYKTIKTNDKELDDKSKLEFRLNKKDRFESDMNKLSIQMLVDSFGDMYDDLYDYEALAEISNPVTIRFLEIFYYKEGFKVELADDIQYAKLIANAREELIKNNFTIIPELLISEIDVGERRSTNRKKIDAEIVASKKYKKFERNYHDVIPIFTKNNHPVIQLASIKNYSVIQYDPETDDYVELDFSYKLLISEILDLLYYYC